VPRVSGIRFDGLPRSVEPETVTALLASCRREHANGRRDYAILLLMSRLGLRAIEVARLELGDFDWRAGVVVVRGKSGRLDLMPIPEEVGAAIADYLACRRSTPSRAVFLQAGGEAVAMSRNAVVFVSRTASQRAGIAVVGGHRLRHTTATQLLRHGASLREVAELLRQSDIVTTSTYAKIDQASLRLAVQSWPQEAGR
jgi:site-specific recombinase XerD